MVLAKFLTLGFAPRVKQDYDGYIASEQAKVGSQFSINAANARFLEKLAARLNPDDIDPGFVMPECYAQFDHTRWPANARP